MEQMQFVKIYIWVMNVPCWMLKLILVVMKICIEFYKKYKNQINKILKGFNDCIPWEVDYFSGTSGGLPGLVEACKILNFSDCSQYACIGEIIV